MDIKVICKYLFSWVARKQELDQRNCFSKKLKSFLSHIWTEYGYLIENLRIQSEYGKIYTRKNSKFRHFLRCEIWSLQILLAVLNNLSWDSENWGDVLLQQVVL